MAFSMAHMKETLFKPGHPFNINPQYKIYGGEDEYFTRTHPKSMVVSSAYVFHYKQVTMEKVPEGRSNFKHQWARKK